MKLIKVGYKENAVLELEADDMTNICNALHHYVNTSDRKDELKEEFKKLRILFRTANNICQYGIPLAEQTIEIVNK